MDIQWIVFANASLAKIFTAPKHPKTAELINTLEHAESHAKTSELVEDKPGHYQKGMAGRGTYSPPHMPKELEQIKFAKNIIDVLIKNKNAHQFHYLTIIAPPHFYGLLLKEMDNNLKNIIIKNIDKDIVQEPEPQLKKYITQELTKLN